MKKAVIFVLVCISVIVFGLENGYAFLWGKKKEETKKEEKTVQKQKEIKKELEKDRKSVV